MIFQALEPLQPQRPHQPLLPQWPQQPLKPYFIKKLPDLEDWIIAGTKMTNVGLLLWNGSSKIQFLLILAHFLPEAVEASQSSVLLPLRANSKRTFQCETPCRNIKLDKRLRCEHLNMSLARYCGRIHSMVAWSAHPVSTSDVLAMLPC